MKITELFETQESVLVIVKKDPGDSKSFWNGANWMASKNTALPVKSSEVPALERQWRTRTKQFPVE